MSGRPSAATERAINRHLVQKMPVPDAARAEGISPSTLYRALERREDDGQPRRTLICGAGALGRELGAWLRRWSDKVAIAFLDDAFALAPPDELQQRCIIGALARDPISAGDHVLVAIADPAARRRVVLETLAGAELARYLDPTAVVGDALIGDGSLLLPFTLVSDRTKIGRHVVLNTYSSIGHDCTVGEFCTFASYVALCGRVAVGDGVEFGVGAKVLPGVSIGDGAVIGAGAVVVRDVQPGQTVFGNPARQVMA